MYRENLLGFLIITFTIHSRYFHKILRYKWRLNEVTLDLLLFIPTWIPVCCMPYWIWSSCPSCRLGILHRCPLGHWKKSRHSELFLMVFTAFYTVFDPESFRKPLDCPVRCWRSIYLLPKRKYKKISSLNFINVSIPQHPGNDFLGPELSSNLAQSMVRKTLAGIWNLRLQLDEN